MQQNGFRLGTRDRIVVAGTKLHEHRVSRHRSTDIQAVHPHTLYGRRGDIDVLPPEQAAFAGVRVESRDGDMGLLQTEACQSLMRQFGHAAQSLRRQT